MVFTIKIIYKYVKIPRLLQWRIHSPHLISHLLCSFIGPKVLPLHFNLLECSVSEHEMFPLQYALGFWLELSFFLHLKYKPINNMINILYIYFKQWNMKNIMDFHCWRQCKFVGHPSNPLKDVKTPKISWCQIGTWSNLNELLLVLMQKYTCSSS